MMGLSRWIAHVDMDSFYVSVERLRDTRLNNKPVVVGGLGPRSVVASASYEARKFGVRSAMPMGQARRLCPPLVVVVPDFTAYSEISKKIFSALSHVAPVVEQVSVDEAYLDFTGCERLYSSRLTSAEIVRENVKQVSGLTASVGVSTNKLLSKIASDLAKPDGALVIPMGEEAFFLGPLSIKKIPGIGPKTFLIFERLGILTCNDLVAKSPSWLRDHLGSYALELRESALGRDDSSVSSEGERRSLSAEETFDVDIGHLQTLTRKLRSMSEEVAASMRAERLEARTVQIKMRYSDFSTVTRAHTLEQPTNLSKELAETAAQLLIKNKAPHLNLRLLGISVKNFCSPDTKNTIRQLDLFEDPNARLKEEKIENLKDELKRKFGKQII